MGVLAVGSGTELATDSGSALGSVLCVGAGISWLTEVGANIVGFAPDSAGVVCAGDSTDVVSA